MGKTRKKIESDPESDQSSSEMDDKNNKNKKRSYKSPKEDKKKNKKSKDNSYEKKKSKKKSKDESSSNNESSESNDEIEFIEEPKKTYDKKHVSMKKPLEKIEKVKKIEKDQEIIEKVKIVKDDKVKDDKEEDKKENGKEDKNNVLAVQTYINKEDVFIWIKSYLEKEKKIAVEYREKTDSGIKVTKFNIVKVFGEDEITSLIYEKNFTYYNTLESMARKTNSSIKSENIRKNSILHLPPFGTYRKITQEFPLELIIPKEDPEQILNDKINEDKYLEYNINEGIISIFNGLPQKNQEYLLKIFIEKANKKDLNIEISENIITNKSTIENQIIDNPNKIETKLIPPSEGEIMKETKVLEGKIDTIINNDF